MTIAIIAAMSEELALLLEKTEQHQRSQHYGLTFYQAIYQGKELVLLEAGIGKVASAVAVTLLKQLFNPRCIINTGSAGGLNPDLSIGDVVISSNAAYFDVDVRAFDYAYGQVPRMPATYPADQDLIELAKQAGDATAEIRVHEGQIVSGDSFVNDAEKVQAILQHFPEAQALEMEAGAIAQSCYLLDIPFVIIRSVSDNADGDAKLTHEEFLAIAAKQSAELALQLVEKIDD